jgi:SNF2 family DNA or RNA helicase
LRPANRNGWTVAVPGALHQRLELVDRFLATLRDGNAEPALHALLQEERARLTREIQTARARKHLHRALHTLKQSLYRYQYDGVERFLMRGRLLLADDMGLGKTAQAIAACHTLWHTGRVRRGLIIVPAALKPQWLREWQFFTDHGLLRCGAQLAPQPGRQWCCRLQRVRQIRNRLGELFVSFGHE